MDICQDHILRLRGSYYELKCHESNSESIGMGIDHIKLDLLGFYAASHYGVSGIPTVDRIQSTALDTDRADRDFRMLSKECQMHLRVMGG